MPRHACAAGRPGIDGRGDDGSSASEEALEREPRARIRVAGGALPGRRRGGRDAAGGLVVTGLRKAVGRLAGGRGLPQSS